MNTQRFDFYLSYFTLRHDIYIYIYIYIYMIFYLLSIFVSKIIGFVFYYDHVDLSNNV